jgi:hypothetical protein
VAGVGHQGGGLGEETGGELDGHKAEVQDEGQQIAPVAGVRRGVVVMAVPMSMTVSMSMMMAMPVAVGVRAVVMIVAIMVLMVVSVVVRHVRPLVPDAPDRQIADA